MGDDEDDFDDPPPDLWDEGLKWRMSYVSSGHPSLQVSTNGGLTWWNVVLLLPNGLHFVSLIEHMVGGKVKLEDGQIALAEEESKCHV